MFRSQLERLYGPLYFGFRKAYERYSAWKTLHEGTTIEAQPFFEGDEQSSLDAVASEYVSISSQAFLLAWTRYSAEEDPQRRRLLRDEMIGCLLIEYHQVRKKLGLDWCKSESESGRFKSISGKSIT